MRLFLFIIFGFLSGIFAGMGMGGGTFLIPLLSLICGVSQVVCQSTNVLCFLCLATICLVIYLKNKMIDFGVVFYVSLSSVLVTIFTCFFSLKINSKILHIIFSSFIILIGVLTLVKLFVDLKNKKG